MRSRYGDLDDRKTDRKTSKIDRKSLKKARKKEKFPHSEDESSTSKHLRYRHHLDTDKEEVVRRHRHRHHKSSQKSKHYSDRKPDCRRSHCRRNRSEIDNDQNKSTDYDKGQSTIQEDHNKSSHRSSSKKTSDDECLIGEILHNITNIQNLKNQEESALVNKSPQQPPLPIYEFGQPPPPPPLPEEVCCLEQPMKKIDPVEISSSINHKLEEKLSVENHEPVKFVIKSQRKSVLDLPMPPVIEDPPLIQTKSHSRSEERSKSTSKHSSSSSHSHNGHQEDVEIQIPQNHVTPPRQTKTRPTIIRQKDEVHNDFEVRSINSFKICHLVGEGTYGKVYKAVDLKSNKTVALKYVRMERELEGIPITSVREIKLLRSLNHPNIVTLNAIVYSDQKKNFSTFLSFEYMNHDLMAILRHEKFVFSEDFIFMIFRQILEGINYCHCRKIIHRDLKCSNIVLNSRGEVKVADWGLGREWVEGRPFTNKVSSLWYRAIELLLGEEKYTTAIDMWSLGCIFGELFRKSAVFYHCIEEVQIINAIFKLCGHPNSVSWPKANLLPHYASFVNSKTKMNVRSVRDNFIGQIPPLALDLLDKMLCLNPERRITANEALQSTWITLMSLRKIKMPFELLESGDYHELVRKMEFENVQE